MFFSIWRGSKSKDEYLRLEIIDRELDRQLAAHAKTSDAIATRAALVVSTAIVFVSLSRDAQESSCAHVFALILSAVGMVVGVWALLLNRSGEEIDLEGAVEKLKDTSSTVALRSMIDAKIETLEQDRRWVEHRELLMRIGFLCLGLSLFSTLIHMMFM